MQARCDFFFYLFTQEKKKKTGTRQNYFTELDLLLASGELATRSGSTRQLGLLLCLCSGQTVSSAEHFDFSLHQFQPFLDAGIYLFINSRRSG